jgi:hypothetical protein
MEPLEARQLLSASAAPAARFAAAAAPVASALVFASEPSSNAAGATLNGSVVVDVMDASGHVLTTGHETITLGIYSGPTGGKLIGTLHATTVDGVATFHDLSLGKAGTYVLKASEAHKLTVNSTSFTVTAPSVATSLAFVEQPTTTVAGVKMSTPVTVEVEDQYGHVLTTDHSTVKLTFGEEVSSQDSSGLHGFKTYSAVVKDGIATFTGISAEKAGSYVLRATDGTLPAVETPNAFTITAGAATHLAFEGVPTKGTAHTAASTLKIDVLDKFNNVVTTNTSTITLTLASAPKNATKPTRTASAIAGTATFSDVTFSTAGKYVLEASGTGLHTIESKSFVLA